MFFDADIRGGDLPPKTLCLTFDDGPGPNSALIASFLTSQGIAATFFLIGAHARAQPDTVRQLREGGHLIGNHTETHPTLVSFDRNGGDLVAEVARADEAIGGPRPNDDPTFFRAPYGEWRDEGRGGISTIAQKLNASGHFPHLVGPVGWDIDARDWQFWREGRSAEEAGQAYLAAIESQNHGIVLMHDWAETEPLRSGNLCLELITWLIPILRERGYSFIRLDDVAAVQSATLGNLPWNDKTMEILPKS